MIDPHEISAMRQMWSSVLALYIEDQVKIFHAAMRGRTGLNMLPNRIAIRDLETEIRAARRYMTGKDFREVCECAGVEVNVKSAIANMLRTAEAYVGGRKGVTADLAMTALAAL